ncbi:MAG: hypothetical protein K5770_03615 [Lachnospiraceae bacterium]|nr:hypothetical protein [Lachnospiraceae bacterium]
MFRKKFVTLCCALAGTAAAFMLSGCAGIDSAQVEAITKAAQDVNIAANNTIAAFTQGTVQTQAEDIMTADAEDVSGEQVTRGYMGLGYGSYESLGYDTDGIVDFYINNYSDYEIVYAYIYPENYPDVEVDILPGTLPSGRSYNYRRTINSYYWDEGNWRIYLVDSDGDTSIIDDVFNPWSLADINVYWDPYGGGYTCEFGYYEIDQQGYYHYFAPGAG